MQNSPLKKFRLGTNIEIPFRISKKNQTQFAQLSGDKNFIHWDKNRVRDFGYREPLVYGGLLVAVVSRLIGMHLPGPGFVWQGLKIDFHSPLSIDAKAFLSAKVTYWNKDLGILRLALEITSNQTLIASGSAQCGRLTPRSH